MANPIQSCALVHLASVVIWTFITARFPMFRENPGHIHPFPCFIYFADRNFLQICPVSTAVISFKFDRQIMASSDGGYGVSSCCWDQFHLYTAILCRSFVGSLMKKPGAPRSGVVRPLIFQFFQLKMLKFCEWFSLFLEKTHEFPARMIIRLFLLYLHFKATKT